MSTRNLCWIDKLVPEELATLDGIDGMMVVDELRFRREQMLKFQSETFLMATMLALVPVQAQVPQQVQAIDAEALADHIAERVADRLGSGRTADIYTTRKGGPHIPGKSRDWMLRRIKEMPGARNVGKDWQITHADYERWLTERDMTKCKAAARPTGVNKTPSNVRDLAEAALARAGFRATK